MGKDRISSCLYKLQELNHYVRVDSAKIDFAELSSLKNYTLVISTEQTTKQQIALDAYCRTHGIKFIIVDCNGPFGMVFNDFGSGF